MLVCPAHTTEAGALFKCQRLSPSAVGSPFLADNESPFPSTRRHSLLFFSLSHDLFSICTPPAPTPPPLSQHICHRTQQQQQPEQKHKSQRHRSSRRTKRRTRTQRAQTRQPPASSSAAHHHRPAGRRKKSKPAKPKIVLGHPNTRSQEYPAKDEFMSIENLKKVDPFADADEDTGETNQSQSYIHIRIQQRNGRKTLTTVQGLPKKFDQKKILKVIKKQFACNGTIVTDEEMGEVIQLQGDQRKVVRDFLCDEKEGLALDSKTIKVHGF